MRRSTKIFIHLNLLLSVVAQVMVHAVETSEKQFGDIGEEHDLDDLIDKNFMISNTTAEEISASNPKPNFSGDVSPPYSHEIIQKSSVASTKNITEEDLSEISDDDFGHEIKMKPEQSHARSVASESPEKATLLTIPATDNENISNGEDNSSVSSGSGDFVVPADHISQFFDSVDHTGTNNIAENGHVVIQAEENGSAVSSGSGDVDNPADTVTQFFDSVSHPDTKTEKNDIDVAPIVKQELKFSPMTDQEIQALSELNKVLDPAHAYMRNSTLLMDQKEDHFRKRIDKDKALQFAKLLRGSPTTSTTPSVDLPQKRDNIPAISRLNPQNENIGFAKPLQTLHLPNFKRNSITIPFRNKPFLLDKRNKIMKPPDLKEIFKRDHIQIRHNLKELAKSHKENTLLRDLSAIQMDWTGYKDKNRYKNPAWMAFLKRAIEPKLGFGAKSSDNIKEQIRSKMIRDPKLLGYLFKPRYGVGKSDNGGYGGLMNKKYDKFYKKVGSLLIKPSEIQQHVVNARKKQFQRPLKTILKPYALVQPQAIITQPGFHLPLPQYIQPASVSPITLPQQNRADDISNCLPENSLCDAGHDEQCCGPSSFCVDYWGVGKCLAFKDVDSSDHNNPDKMAYNLKYKNYYNYLLGRVKNEIATQGYQVKVGDVLKAASLSR